MHISKELFAELFEMLIIHRTVSELDLVGIKRGIFIIPSSKLEKARIEMLENKCKRIEKLIEDAASFIEANMEFETAQKN